MNGPVVIEAPAWSRHKTNRSRHTGGQGLRRDAEECTWEGPERTLVVLDLDRQVDTHSVLFSWFQIFYMIELYAVALKPERPIDEH